MRFRCCGALSSGRLSVVPAPKPEPSLWWSLYGGEATKALGFYRGFRSKTRVFYSGFRRNVWHRAHATGGLKSAPVDLSGHAVSLLRCSVFWASFCSPGAKTWAITMVESLWWRSYQGLRFLLSIQAQRLTSGGCQGGCEKRSCGPLWPCCFAAVVLCLLGCQDLRLLLWIQAQRLTSGRRHGGSEKCACGAKTRVFYSGFRRNVWHRAHATLGLKSAPVDLSGHAVSLLRRSVFWASFCSPGAKTWAITMVVSLWWRSYQGLRFLQRI